MDASQNLVCFAHHIPDLRDICNPAGDRLVPSQLGRLAVTYGSYPGKGGGIIAMYVWQMPVMLLNVSILLFKVVVGVLIPLWEHSTRDLALNHNLKVCR